MTKEPRKIVLILGNGFDLDLGLKTSYKDFWESKYCPRDYPAPIIKHLNQHWPGNLDKVKWYDLENELYYYAKKTDTAAWREDVITTAERELLRIVKPEYICFGLYTTDYSDQINSLLNKGIIVEDSKCAHRYRIPYLEELLKSALERDKIALELIKKGLCEYIKKIESPKDERNTVAYNVLLSLLKTAEKEFVEIFTFNYTQVRRMGHVVNEVPVNYMHGSCDAEKVIIGTRDDTEIENDYAFLQKAFDPTFYPPQIVDSLQSADEVIIFGHSIGENDRQYFKSFFIQQANYSEIKGKDITIFTRDQSSEMQVKLALQNMTDGNLSNLFCRNRVQIIKTENLEEDQNRFLDFLVVHHTDVHFAEEIISELISKKYYR